MTDTEIRLALLETKTYVEKKAVELGMDRDELVNQIFPVTSHGSPLVEEFLEFVKECLSEYAFTWPKDGYALFQTIIAWLVIALALSLLSGSWILVSHLLSEVFH